MGSWICRVAGRAGIIGGTELDGNVANLRAAARYSYFDPPANSSKHPPV